MLSDEVVARLKDLIFDSILNDILNGILFYVFNIKVYPNYSSNIKCIQN